MHFYFSTEYPTVIKFNGVYQGVLDKEVVSTVQQDGCPLFVEVCPLLQTEQPFSLLLTEEFLCSPPPNVTVTDLKGGYLVNLCKTDKCQGFKVLSQLKDKDFVATVFYDGGLQFSFESKDCFFADSLRPFSNQVEIKPVLLDGKPMIALLFEADKKFLALYQISKSPQKVFECLADQIIFEGDTVISGNGYPTKIVITEIKEDIAKHTLQRQLFCNENGVTAKTLSLSTAENFNISHINPKILPFAFFEELCVNGNFTECLGENLKPNAQKIVEFIGEFIGVMPPPFFRKIEEVGLIKKQSENLFYVDYYTLEIINGKVTNISVADK